jgi:hypothetical protein
MMEEVHAIQENRQNMAGIFSGMPALEYIGIRCPSNQQQ